MPVYQFECEGCGKRFEELVAYSRREAMTCPDCQGRTRVLVSAFAAKVEGGGGGGGGASNTAPARPRFT